MQMDGAAAAVSLVSRERLAEQCYFLTHDGVKLAYRYWRGTGDRAIVLIHRGHEHSGRMTHLIDELDLPDASFFAWDARAHGLSEGEQGATTTMATFVQDLDEFIRHICGEFQIPFQNIALIAQSVGAVIAAAWLHDYGPPVRCAVLAAPAFRVKLYVPFARLGVGIWHKLIGDFYVKSYVKGKALTHDPERIASYHSDPLINLRISARVLLDLYKISGRIVADAAAIRVPIQILLSGSDWVIRNTPPRQFFQGIGTDKKEIRTFPGFFHDTLGEKDRHLPIAAARAFLERQFALPASRQSLRNADRAGFTKTEYDSLSRPLSPLSLKRLTFALTRGFLHSIGRLSNGIRLGCDTGFDSGSSLDYVYRNRPSGLTPLGTLIDWFYLNSPGWAGIRVRKQLIEELIGRALNHVHRSGAPVRIIDVAAGHGRYVLDAIVHSGIKPDYVLLRDFDPRNVAAGKGLLAQSGFAGNFEQGDAFHCASLLALQPTPTVGIISGLFELFPENDGVCESLKGLAGVIAPGGYLVYTGQPWHPQIEFIARTLSSHRDGKPWVMRRRTQEELDELVRLAGFRKIEQRIDPNGLFTVTLAERA